MLANAAWCRITSASEFRRAPLQSPDKVAAGHVGILHMLYLHWLANVLDSLAFWLKSLSAVMYCVRSSGTSEGDCRIRRILRILRCIWAPDSIMPRSGCGEVQSILTEAFIHDWQLRPATSSTPCDVSRQENAKHS